MPQSWFDQFREVDEPPPRVAGTSWFDQFREVDAPTTYDDEFGRPAVPSSRVVGPRKARALGSEPDVRARRGWPEPPALAPLESRPLVPSSLLSPVVLPTLAPRRVGPMQPQTGQARRSDDQADVVGRSDRDPPTIPNRAIRYRAAKRPPPEADRPPSPADQEFGTPRIPQPRDGTDGSRIRDLGISLAKGLITVPDAALGLSDIFMTGGFAGQGAETLGFRPTEWKATLDTYYSDQQQRANRSVQEADGLIEKATAALTHPSTIAHAVIESLPLMVAGGAVGRVVSTAMRPFMAGAVGEGIVSAGASAAEIRQQSETGRLTPGQRAVAGTSGTLTGGLGALGGRIAERLGVVDVNTLLAAGLTDPVAYQNLFRAIVFGAFQEGVLEELPQSVQEQVLQNAATDRPLWEHVDTAAVMGTLAGAVMGGGAQVAALAGPRTTAPETGVDEPAPGPPSGDVAVSDAPTPTGRPTPAAQPTSWFDQFQEAGDTPLDAPPPTSPGARIEEEIDIARPAVPVGAPAQGVPADRAGEAPRAVDPPAAGEARKSARAPQVTREALGPPETRELRRIAAELEAFPFAGKTYREAGPGRGGDLEVQGRTPGAPVYWDIVGGTPERPVFRYSRGQVAEKLQAFLRDGTRSVVSDLAVDVAQRRLQGDPTVRTPDLPPEAGDPRIQVTPLEGLSDADAAVQARAIRAVEANPDELVQRYEARFGKVVGADHAKTLFGEDYTDPESRTRHTQAVHQPSSALAHHIFETRMQAAQPGDLMLMLSGGPGSGKTSSIRNIPELPDVAHTIYDSNLTRRDGATRDIEAALDANLDVGIVHVLRDPVVAFRDGVVPRAETQGRIVTIAQHVRNHGQARETFRALQKQYADNDRVGFTVIDNRGSAPEVVGVDVLNHEEYNEDDVRRRITHALEDAHAAGRISDAVYAATKGASAQGVAEDPGRRHPPIQRVGRQVARLGRVEPSPPRDAAQPTTRRTRPLVLTKNPAGTWSFGGSVPKDLAYADRATGAPISDEDAAQIAQHGPGLFRARIRSLTWPSEADALAAARALGIDEVDGYDGKTIPTSPAREARADTDDDPPPTGGGSGAANVGTFAPARPGRATTTPARPQTIHPIEFPELVDLARRLQRTPKVVRAFRKAGQVGEFRPGSIRLAADLFKTGQEQQLAKTLAHEIGHLIDWLPTPTLKRGNILGRLRSLRSYLRGTFTGPDGTTIKNAVIRDELKSLSATWRPWNRATSPARFRQYRDSSRELFADAVSVLLNDPEMLKRDAPQFAQAFFDGLDAKPDVKQAYFDLQEQLSGTRVDLVEKRRAGVRRMWHEGNVKALELEQLRQAQTTERRQHLWFRLRHELLDKHTTFLDRVHALEQRGVTINPDDDPRYLLSERNYLGGKLKGFVEEQFAPIHQEILESGVRLGDVWRIAVLRPDSRRGPVGRGESQGPQSGGRDGAPRPRDRRSGSRARPRCHGGRRSVPRGRQGRGDPGPRGRAVYGRAL